MATTAQKLIAFRNELISGGMNPELVADVVRDAAQNLVMHHGLVVALLGPDGTSPSEK